MINSAPETGPVIISFTQKLLEAGSATVHVLQGETLSLGEGHMAGSSDLGSIQSDPRV